MVYVLSLYCLLILAVWAADTAWVSATLHTISTVVTYPVLRAEHVLRMAQAASCLHTFSLYLIVECYVVVVSDIVLSKVVVVIDHYSPFAVTCYVPR